jgi:hypothetical protein
MAGTRELASTLVALHVFQGECTMSASSRFFLGSALLLAAAASAQAQCGSKMRGGFGGPQGFMQQGQQRMTQNGLQGRCRGSGQSSQLLVQQRQMQRQMQLQALRQQMLFAQQQPMPRAQLRQGGAPRLAQPNQPGLRAAQPREALPRLAARPPTDPGRVVENPQPQAAKRPDAPIEKIARELPSLPPLDRVNAGAQLQPATRVGRVLLSGALARSSGAPFEVADILSPPPLPEEAPLSRLADSPDRRSAQRPRSLAQTVVQPPSLPPMRIAP